MESGWTFSRIAVWIRICLTRMTPLECGILSGCDRSGKVVTIIDSMYPSCGICKKGTLLPVNMGREGERCIIYRCTDHECNVRFDEHGYERYDDNLQDWVRLGLE